MVGDAVDMPDDFVVRVPQDVEDVSTDDDLEEPDIGSGDWVVV